jgi:hypothetical protein
MFLKGPLMHAFLPILKSDVSPWATACGDRSATVATCSGQVRKTAQLILTGVLIAVTAGCGSLPPTFAFDELDVASAEEELSEISLGEYRIPIPVVEYQADNQPIHRTRFHLDFELFALASPKRDGQIKAAWQRHRGKIRDRVIRVCRSVPLDELRESELGTLKARLMDALCQQLGEKQVRQLLISEITSQDI